MNNFEGKYVEFVGSKKKTLKGIDQHLSLKESAAAVIIEDEDENRLAVWKTGLAYFAQWLPLKDPNDAEMYESLDEIFDEVL